jgi:Lysozyme like domain
MARIAGANVPLIPTTMIVVGGYLAWFAVRYWRDVDQIYPSGPVKSLLTGKGLPTPVREGSTADPDAAQNNIGTVLGSLAQSVVTGTATEQVGTGVAGGTGAGQTQFSKAQLQQLWTTNGGDPDYAGWASAIAEAESSGNAQASSPNPDGGTNYGLWQLDTKGVGSGYSQEQLEDPNGSTQIVIMATRNGVDWSDWGDSVTAQYGYTGIKNFTG